jgi:hypothetical protein
VQERIAELIPDSQPAVFERSMHSPPADKPEPLQKTAGDFLISHALRVRTQEA